MSVLILVLAATASLATSLYAVHLATLLWLFMRRQQSVRASQRAIIERFVSADERETWPVVTTQLPIYNESDVIARLLAAVTAMDYPADRHEIQILDDSTDETCDLVDRLVERYRARGHDIKAVRRTSREGYKAGALRHATPLARGALLAVFDADFVPPRDFLKQTVAMMVERPGAACVQGRWTHLNRDESWLTRAQALGIDGHFAIEQGARAWNGLLMNFNGTAGIWRKAAIEDPAAGGWSADTLTEDLDLSYRVQLAGWSIEYCIDVPCPAEVPGTAAAFKSQQQRWATGSMQVAVKLLPRIWRSALTPVQKLEATLHLTHYTVALFMLVLAVIARPMLLVWSEPLFENVAFIGIWITLGVMALVPPTVYAYARYILGEGWSGWRVIPWMLMLGVGICLNNAVAVVRGMYLRGGEFVRTPKSGSTSRARARSSYAAVQGRLWMVEFALGVYSLWTFGRYVGSGHYVFSVFLLLYGTGFLLMSWASRPGATAPQRGPNAEKTTLEPAAATTA